MKRRMKVYICNFCGKTAFPTLELSVGDSWKTRPHGWTAVGRKTHYCDVCSNAIDDVRRRLKNEEQR